MKKMLCLSLLLLCGCATVYLKDFTCDDAIKQVEDTIKRIPDKDEWKEHKEWLERYLAGLTRIRETNTVNDRNGQDVLLDAVQWNHINTVRWLIREGVDVNVENKGVTILMHAIDAENTEIVKMLVDAGADVNAWGGKWGPPLMVALSKDNIAIIKALIDGGANVNARFGGKDGIAMLFIPVMKKDIYVTEMLIAAGADVNVKSIRGETALETAKSIGCAEIVKLLEKAGAK